MLGSFPCFLFAVRRLLLFFCDHWHIIAVKYGFLSEKLLCSEGRRYSQASGRWYWTSFRRPLHHWSRSEYSASSLSLVNRLLNYTVCLILALCVSYLSSLYICFLVYLQLVTDQLSKLFSAGDNIKWSLLFFTQYISLVILVWLFIFRSVGKVHDEWFADEERVRNTVGILENPVVPPSDDDTEVCPLNCRILSLFAL